VISPESNTAEYFPYGEERNYPALPNDQVKFATYTRDNATGLDYADQRYYGAALGRFMTPDPYSGSGGPSDPQSWNRYAYAGGDPVNLSDPSGLIACGDIAVTGGGTLASDVNANSDLGHMIDLVWHEAGTLSQTGNSLVAWQQESAAIAQAIWNRYQLALGNVSVVGADGHTYTGIAHYQGRNRIPDNPYNVNRLGYLPIKRSRRGQRSSAAPTLNNIIIGAAGGTNVVNRQTGALINNAAGLASDLNQDQDLKYASGKIPFYSDDGQLEGYLTEGCYSVWQADYYATGIYSASFSYNSPGFFPTSWNTSGNNANAGVESLLGTKGPTYFYGFTNWH
jgi:RHS repeat-associated protein